MGQDSKIEWTHHTFNPWWGCTRVSEGCRHCYAEEFAQGRFGLNIWGSGPDTGRKFFGEKHWAEPFAWDRKAANLGVRHRVFCASMADVFEGDETIPEGARAQVKAERPRLFKLIRKTPNLDWLLLTKRPQNIRALTREAIDTFDDPEFDFNAAGEPNGLDVATYGDLFPNVWLGTSVENQKTADDRIPQLLEHYARVRFLSMEPLLGPVALDGWLGEEVDYEDINTPRTRVPGINWAIVGGESGSNSRPMHQEWARSVRDQCLDAGVPFFFKQWGEFDHDGHWRGKKAAGRLLDGRTWEEVPS